MSSVPAGKRNWKCPECGTDVLLSITQLDPIACDACLAKMKSSRTSAGVGTVADADAGPMGIWSGLPEMTKLAIAVGGLVIGLFVGFIAGQSMASPSVGSRTTSTHEKSAVHSKEVPAEDDPVAEETEPRPDPPGPGYKWMPGRKHKDGTRGSGYWAKDPHYKGDDDSPKKKSSK